MTVNQLDDRLKEAFGAAPTWHPHTAEAMQAVRRRAGRRLLAERVVGVASGVLVISLAVTTVAALRPDGNGDGTRSVRTAGTPTTADTPTVDQSLDVTVDGSSATTTPDPSHARPGRDPVRGEGKVASSPGVTFPPYAKPTTGPTPSTTTTAPHMDAARPPVAFASINGEEVAAAQGPTCWERSGNGSGSGKSECTDAPADWWKSAPLVDAVPSGYLWFRWAIGEQPTHTKTVAQYSNGQPAYRDELTCNGGNPCYVDLGLVTFSTDSMYVIIQTSWGRGTVSHAVRLNTSGTSGVESTDPPVGQSSSAP
jgi:hypothetical protein